MPAKLLTTERAFDEAALEAEMEAQAAFDKWQAEFKGKRGAQQSPADAVDSPPNPDQAQPPAGGQPPQGY